MTRNDLRSAINALSAHADLAGMSDIAKDLDEVAKKLQEPAPRTFMMRLTSPFLGPNV